MLACAGRDGLPLPAVAGSIERVVVFVQENHTVDNYFRGLAPYGANVVTDWPTTPNPPASDQNHDRKAYFRWLTQGTANRSQFDTAAVIPYYLHLAVTGAFLENHCSGFGTNSTANHMILVGGQSPTLKNPPFSGPAPSWDLPSVFGLAEQAGVSWRAYAAANDYPVHFYSELLGSPNVVGLERVPCGRPRGRAAAAGVRMARHAAGRAPTGRRHDRHGSHLAVGGRGRPGRRVGADRVHAHLGRLGWMGRPRGHPGRRIHPG